GRIRCRVYLNDIGNRPILYATAGRTFITRFTILLILAIDGFGKNLRSTRFPGATRAGENIRMGKFLQFYSMLECLCDMRLTNDITELFRPPDTVQCLIAHIFVPL